MLNPFIIAGLILSAVGLLQEVSGEEKKSVVKTGAKGAPGDAGKPGETGKTGKPGDTGKPGQDGKIVKPSDG